MFYVPQKGTETSPFINSPGEISPSSQAMAAKGELEFSPRVSQVTPRGEVLEMVQYYTHCARDGTGINVDEGQRPHVLSLQTRTVNCNGWTRITSDTVRWGRPARWACKRW